MGLAPVRGEAHRLPAGAMLRDALCRDLPLLQREGQKHVQRQAAHAGGRIEGLDDGHEGCACHIEQVDDHREVRKRPGQPVDLVDHELLDPAAQDIVEELGQCRAFQTAA